MEDAARLDDSGEGTLERPMRHQPMPPPRIDSYRMMHQHGRGSGSRSGSGSEIYERLPADSGSLGDDLEDRLRISDSEGDSDGPPPNIYTNMEQQRTSNGQGEHLVKPSQLKHNKNKPKPPSRPRPNKHGRASAWSRTTCCSVDILKLPNLKQNAVFVRVINVL